ncbi:hypothetical protein L6164_002880 [Bauhinia variegata]|uniref:Uncharacterized protein n=1 Tax=Bauhinia variegata TaxID=167791 RepID=A0ACB9PZ49_BAUVA|nr:hypothetical protein L6164_002880 [Bauhinia variegata]
MPVSVKNPNELEKLTEQELLYLQDDQLKKKLTQILREKVKVSNLLALCLRSLLLASIDMSQSSQAEGQTREYYNTCRFSITERLKHWSIEGSKRRKEKKYDLHYIHRGLEFRSVKEVLNFVLHEKYPEGLNKKRNKGIAAENSVILHETDPLEAIQNKYVEGDDGCNKDIMIPKGIVEQNLVILHEIDPLEVILQVEGDDGSNEDETIPKEIDAETLVILHETDPLMEAIMNMCEEGYYPSNEDQMMIPIGPTAANLVIPYETGPLEVIKNMHEEGHEGSNEDQMMIPNWTALDIKLDAAIDYPLCLSLSLLGVSFVNY